jgi:hypothetical protein
MTDKYGEPSDAQLDEAYGDYIGRDITEANALVVIAREMRHIRHVLEESLQTQDPDRPTVSLATALTAIAEAAGVKWYVDEDTAKTADSPAATSPKADKSMS